MDLAFEPFGAVSLSDLPAKRDGELSIQKGEKVLVCRSVGGGRGFWHAVRGGARAGQGLIPKAHLRRCELQLATLREEAAGWHRRLPRRLGLRSLLTRR